VTVETAPAERAEESPAQGPAASTAPAPSPVRRVLDHAPLAILLLLMLLVTKVASKPLNNGDTWFHLRLGHELWGPWSLSHPGQPTRFATAHWVPTQWSTEMLSAKLEDWFGLPGVAWMYGVVFLAFLLAVYLVCRRQAGPVSSAVASGLTVFAASTTMSARPQMVSLVLLAVALGAWFATARDGRPRWWLIPMTWVWATAHGLWTTGIVLGLVCWLGLVLDGRARGRRAWQLLAIPVGSFVAALLTPVGPRLVTSQLEVSKRTPMIAEWGATSFRTFPALVIAVMIAALVVLWLRGGRVGWMPVLLLGVACGWAMLVTRMVAPAAVLVAPLLAQAATAALPAARRRLARLPAETVTIGVAAVACLAGLALAVPQTADHAAGVPTGFAARLSALPEGSAVLVEDSTGSWIEWRFPGVQPIIDGLLDSYSVPYMRDFDVFWRAEPGWDRFVSRTGARVGVMLKGSTATTALEEQLHWRPVQYDGDWVYLVAPGER
jgi:hypothetical protein